MGKLRAAEKKRVAAVREGGGWDAGPSVWDDVPTPRLVPPFGSTPLDVAGRKVAAGGLHSCVVDESGRLWTWGGGGHGACLGHGECSDGEPPTKNETKFLSGGLTLTFCIYSQRPSLPLALGRSARAGST